MKLKKKEVSRLHEIIYGPSFYSGNEEVSEIKSILNKICERSQDKKQSGPKTVQEEPLNLAEFFKRMASYDHRKSVFKNITKEGESMIVASTDEGYTTRGIRDIVESMAEPKIGDVGYFYNNDPDYVTIYGKIKNYNRDDFQANNKQWYRNFSKTPPNLK